MRAQVRGDDGRHSEGGAELHVDVLHVLVLLSSTRKGPRSRERGDRSRSPLLLFGSSPHRTIAP
jgi:hypothetical protein